MVGGEFRVFLPVRRYYLVPLPVEDRAEVRRPRAGDPVGSLGIRSVTRASGKIDHRRYSKLFGKQNCLTAYVTMLLPDGLVGMERVAVTTQGADAEAMIGDDLLEIGQ